MKQTILSLLLALLPIVASAEAVEIGGIYYNLVPNGKLARVTKGPNDGEGTFRYSGNVVIPESVEYDGVIYNVISIERSAFNGCRSLTSITIPKSITSIGDGAFSGCSDVSVFVSDWESWYSIRIEEGGTDSLPSDFALYVNGQEVKEIVVPTSVTSIGYGAFWGCKSLTTATITDNVKFIDKYAFVDCKNLTTVVLPNSLASIETGVFWNCINLSNVTIPNSVTSIDGFAGCTALKDITIPNSVTRISGFAGCTALTDITIPNSVTSIGSLAFAGCTSLSNISMSNSVTSIGSSAFAGCTALTNISIPNSVTSIGNSAFMNCKKLTSVAIPDNVSNIESQTFYNCSGLSTISIGNSVLHIYEKAFGNCTSLLDVYNHSLELMYGLDHWTSNDAFDNSYIEYVTLHVPESSIEAYKKHAPWSGFGEIVPLSPYTLTYYVDGEVYKTYLHEAGIAIPEEEAPEKEGYTFSGWSEIPETMPDHDVEVTGTFTVNKYNLIYMVDGEEYKTVEIEYGAEITPEDGPEKEGYTFKGWSEIPQTMPANDVTVNGTFVKNSLGKCATPTIAFKDGKFKFESTEEGVEFVWSITIADSKEGRGNEVDINGRYKVSVYATKEEYEDSDAATIEVDIRGKQGDVSGDGEVDATDITKLIDILLKKNTTTNTEQ